MQAWGAVNYHNAVVISREPGDPTDHNEEASKVKRDTRCVHKQSMNHTSFRLRCSAKSSSHGI